MVGVKPSGLRAGVMVASCGSAELFVGALEAQLVEIERAELDVRGRLDPEVALSATHGLQACRRRPSCRVFVTPGMTSCQADQSEFIGQRYDRGSRLCLTDARGSRRIARS